MLAPGLPPHVPQWRWTCNFYGKPGGGGSGSGDDLDYCKRQFKAAWAPLRAGLSHADITLASRCGGEIISLPEVFGSKTQIIWRT
jgi:hypothetical protein